MGFWEEIGDAPIKENDPFNLGGILKLAKGLGAVGSGGFGAKKIVDAAKKFWEEIGDAPAKDTERTSSTMEKRNPGNYLWSYCKLKCDEVNWKQRVGICPCGQYPDTAAETAVKEKKSMEASKDI